MKPSAAVYWATLGLAVLLPFAAIPPLLSTPWFGATDDKLIILVLVIAWLALGRCALPTRHELRLLAPTALLIVVCVVSAVLAPADYLAEAARYIARLVAAGFVMLVALRVGNPRGLLWAIAVGAGISGLLGIGEALHIAALEPVLALFKVAPTRVGGELRVSASFQYATIASMYFEMVTPLALVLATTARRMRLQVLGGAIAIVCTANVVLSLTRAGMLTLFLLYAIALGVWAYSGSRLEVRPTSRVRHVSQSAELLVELSPRTVADTSCVARRFSATVRTLAPAIASAAALVLGASVLFLQNPVFDLRLVSESDADWYGAVYQAPAALEVDSNQVSTVDLEVRNEGRITWTNSGKHPFALGYRWLSRDGSGVLDIPPAEVQLTHDVPPGESIQLRADLTVPDLPTGTYRLDWGMLQRDVLQFYERGWADAETRVLVDNPAGGNMPNVTERDDGEAPWVVGRLDLWSAALHLAAAHPVLGLGPDNFRHFYGAEFGLEAWDERVGANNLYLEVLSDLGVLGLVAFLWVVVEPLRSAVRRMGDPLFLGIALALGAFLVHGLLDSFLAFTPTVLLFWLLLGLGQKPQVSGR